MLVEFLRDDSGGDLAEYTMLLCLLGFIAFFILFGMGSEIGGILKKVNDKLRMLQGNPEFIRPREHP